MRNCETKTFTFSTNKKYSTNSLQTARFGGYLWIEMYIIEELFCQSCPTFNFGQNLGKLAQSKEGQASVHGHYFAPIKFGAQIEVLSEKEVVVTGDAIAYSGPYILHQIP